MSQIWRSSWSWRPWSARSWCSSWSTPAPGGQLPLDGSRGSRPAHRGALATVTTLAAVVAAVLGPRRRRRSVGLVGALTVTWGMVVVLGAPTPAGDRGAEPAGDGEEMTLLTQNLWYQNDDPGPDRTSGDGSRCRRVVLVEYTPAHAERSVPRVSGGVPVPLGRPRRARVGVSRCSCRASRSTTSPGSAVERCGAPGSDVDGAA